MWLKVWKTYRGGTSKIDYIESETDDDSQKENAKDWAANTSGGHCYGWKVYWEPVICPSDEWINEKIKSTEHAINSFKDYMYRLKKLKYNN